MSVRNIKLNDYKSLNESEEVSDKEFQEHLEDAMKRINGGEMPEDVFNVDGDWGSGCLRIKLDDKYNMLTWDRSTKQYRLLFDKWYIYMGKSFRWGWLDIADDRMMYNYINKDGEIFAKLWDYNEVSHGKYEADMFVKGLEENADYIRDEKTKAKEFELFNFYK